MLLVGHVTRDDVTGDLPRSAFRNEIKHRDSFIMHTAPPAGGRPECPPCLAALVPPPPPPRSNYCC